MTPFTDSQLRMLRSLISPGGWPDNLLQYLFSRCGDPKECESEWLELVSDGAVEQDTERRWWMAAAGRIRYSKERRGRYF